MMNVKQQSRFIAGLLALVIFVVQTSTVFATVNLNEPGEDRGHHCMMKEKVNKEQSQSHMQSVPECCKTIDCAKNFCIPHLSSLSTALFNSIVLHQSSNYAQTTLDTSDQLQTGIDPSSLDRPPRISI